MIRFAMPWLLGAGVLGAIVITALHFLSVRRPAELLLPTARFLDEGRVRAVSRSAQPSDLLLLVLRVLALLLACAAIAGPRWMSRDRGTVNLFVADVRYRADSMSMLQLLSARAHGNPTTFVWGGRRDSATEVASGLQEDLAAALPLAMRAATALVAERPEVDSIALYVYAGAGGTVSLDGWRAWRSTWPGGVRVLEPTQTERARDTTVERKSDGAGNAANDVTAATIVSFDRSAPDELLRDPVRSAFTSRVPSVTASNASSASSASSASTAATAASASSGRGVREIRVQRGVETSTGGAAASLPVARSVALGDARQRDTRNGEVVTIRWPESGVPTGWQPMTDTATGVAARGVAMVGEWTRTAHATTSMMRDAVPIAWWSDGQVAATERGSDSGCVRDVAIVVPPASDMLLDASANGLMQALLAPCTGTASAWAIPALLRNDSLDRSNGRAAPSQTFQRSDLPKPMSSPHWLAPTLLALALLLLILEWALRDREGPEARADAASAGIRT